MSLSLLSFIIQEALPSLLTIIKDNYNEMRKLKVVYFINDYGIEKFTNYQTIFLQMSFMILITI